MTRYLRDLGVTAVELLPVQHFITEPGVADRGLVNYWGYNTIGFFAPQSPYSSGGERGQQVTEFKQMVKNFHAAGIEVILDVVYNHTAEGGPDGPAYSFRGLDDVGFYKRSGTVGDAYWDVTGCGNTVDATNLGALRLILDSLRYWVTEMHVDGFRFDLASALARTGHDVDMRSAFLTTISQDPVLRHVKLIAEPWDASMDGYQVGSFPPPWVEWNDRFRDTVRDFWRGQGSVPRRGVPAGRLVRPVRRRRPLAVRLGQLRHRPRRLHPARPGVLRPQAQRGQRRGQPRRLRQQPVVEPRRRGRDRRPRDRGPAAPAGGQPDGHPVPVQSGSPMLTAGDERGRTQGGNNNAYCQDNEISWVDWRPDDAWLDLYEITKAALRLRREHPALRQRHHFVGAPTIDGRAQGPGLAAPLGPRDDRAGLVRRATARGRDVRLRRPAALPRPARRAAAGRVVPDLAQHRPRPVEVTLPENQWVNHGEVVLSTDTGNPVGTPVAAGDELTLQGRSVLVLRQT